jgi:hypothetical protein
MTTSWLQPALLPTGGHCGNSGAAEAETAPPPISIAAPTSDAPRNRNKFSRFC